MLETQVIERQTPLNSNTETETKPKNNSDRSHDPPYRGSTKRETNANNITKTDTQKQKPLNPQTNTKQILTNNRGNST